MERGKYKLPHMRTNERFVRALIRLCNNSLDNNDRYGRTVDNLRGIELETPDADHVLDVMRNVSSAPSWVREQTGGEYFISSRRKDAWQSVEVSIRDRDGTLDVEANEPISRKELERLAGQIALGEPVDLSMFDSTQHNVT